MYRSQLQSYRLIPRINSFFPNRFPQIYKLSHSTNYPSQYLYLQSQCRIYSIQNHSQIQTNFVTTSPRFQNKPQQLFYQSPILKYIPSTLSTRNSIHFVTTKLLPFIITKYTFSTSTTSPPSSISSKPIDATKDQREILSAASTASIASDTVENKTPEQIQLENDIKLVIETKIADAIRLDGGDIHFIQYIPDLLTVEVALSGACESCDRSAITLQILVSNALKHYFPNEITKVKRVYLPGQEPH